MAIEADLRTYLLAQAGISALVSTRCYPLTLPQGVTLPAITYQTIAHPGLISHDGAVGLARVRIQVDCWDDDYAGALALGAQVRSALLGYAGAMGATAAANGRIVNELDDYEPETKIWRRLVDAAIWHA